MIQVHFCISKLVLHSRLILILRDKRIAALRRDAMEVVLAKGGGSNLQLPAPPSEVLLGGWGRRHPALAEFLDATFATRTRVMSSRGAKRSCRYRCTADAGRAQRRSGRLRWYYC